MHLIFALFGLLSWLQLSQGYKLDNPIWNARRNNLGINGVAKRTLLIRSVEEFRLEDWRGGDDAPIEDMKKEDKELVALAFEHAREYGIAMLRITRDNPLYVQAFGDPEGIMYDTVMQMVRRVVNLAGDATAEELGQQPAPGDDVDRPLLRIVRLENQDDDTAIANTADDTIIFRDRFFVDNDVTNNPIVPASESDLEDPEFLNAAAFFHRGAIAFHELLHYVSQEQQSIQAVNEAAEAAGATVPRREDGTFWINRIRDLYLNVPERMFWSRDGARQQEDSAFAFGLAPETQAYSADTIGRLARMTYGRYMAALNAHTYTQVAVAAFLNLSARAFEPHVANAPPIAGPSNTQQSIYPGPIAEDNGDLIESLRHPTGRRMDRSMYFSLLGLDIMIPDFRKNHDL